MAKVKAQNAHLIAVRFQGGLEYLTGLPARDMTLAEWETYPDDLRAQALSLGLYEVYETVEAEVFTKEEGEGQTGGLQ